MAATNPTTMACIETNFQALLKPNQDSLTKANILDDEI